MNIIEILTNIDRRIIYLILLIVVILPLLFPSVEKVRVMPPVEKLYYAIDTISAEKAVIVDFDYEPQTAPELDPMGFAILRHVFKRRIKLLV
jgi:bifunctional DNase/RNase